MSSSSHDREIAAPIQGVSWNEEDWQGMLKRLPSNWQEQAVKLKAWQRVRKLVQVSDLLRALLVYAACGYSFRQLGLWATLVGVGCLSERAWRKRVERAQEWIAWLLGALIGSQVSPGWLPSISGLRWNQTTVRAAKPRRASSQPRRTGIGAVMPRATRARARG